MGRRVRPEDVSQALSDLGRVSIREGIVRVELRDPRDLRRAAERLTHLGFDHVASLTVVDRLKEKKLQLIYVAESYSDPGILVELVVELPRDNPRVPSLHDIWPSLLWQERENWEMFGVVFEGHPDLRHLLLPPDWPEGVYPLRKDFVVREDPITAPPELQKRLEEMLSREDGGGAAGERRG